MGGKAHRAPKSGRKAVKKSGVKKSKRSDADPFTGIGGGGGGGSGGAAGGAGSGDRPRNPKVGRWEDEGVASPPVAY